MSLSGVVDGTIAAKNVVRMYRKSDCGCCSLISTVPALSSTTIPEISEHFVGVASQASLPTMLEKNPIPGEFSLKSRMIVFLKSLALTDSPFEYFSPLRSVNLRSVPSLFDWGRLCAIAGMIFVQPAPTPQVPYRLASRPR